MVLLTAGLVLVGVVQAIVTVVTLKGLQHAKTAAEAAKHSADTAADTARRQLRAYVGPTSFRLKDWAPSVEGHASITMEYENLGSTPAHDFTVWLGVLVTTNPDDAKFGKDREIPLSKSIVFPRQGGSVVIAFPRNMALWGSYQAGDLTIFAFGRMDYVDVFGEAHQTSFRFQHDRDRREGYFGGSIDGNYAE